MARPGVTYHDVANAAFALQGLGKNVTIENIRAELKTGSHSTVGPHLKAWRKTQDGTQEIACKENIPPELVSLLKGLWERVMQQADDKITLVENDYRQEIQILQTERQQLQHDNKNWQQQHHSLFQEKEGLTIVKAQLEESVASLQKDQIAALAKQENFAEQLQEKQTRVEELHRLHHQVQTNLEHYREAAREQRLLDQQKFEQREQQLEQTVHQLQQTLKITEQSNRELKQQYENLCLASSALKTTNDQHVVLIEKSQHDLSNADKKLAEQLHLLQLSREQQALLQQKVDEQNEKVSHLQTQLALVSQELTQSKKELTTVSDQHTTLAHEKWYLMQEKSQLEGQLKQMDKLLSHPLTVETAT